MAFGDNQSQVKEILRLVQVKDFLYERASQHWLQAGYRGTATGPRAQLGLVLRQGDDSYDLYSLPFWIREILRERILGCPARRTQDRAWLRDARETLW